MQTSNLNVKPTHIVKWVGKKFTSVPLFVAIPDTGLISLLTAVNIVNQSKMPVTSYIESQWLPAVISIIEGEPLPPVRLYSDDKIAILLSEVPIYAEYWTYFSKLVIDICNEINPVTVIGATGLPNQKRHSLEKLRLFVSYTDKSFKERYLKDISNFSGLLAGPYAVILRYLMMEGISAILLLVDSFPNYPDPEAAAIVSEVIGKLVGVSYDVSLLLEKASQIKIMARKLAAETQKVQAELTSSTGRPSVGFYV